MQSWRNEVVQSQFAEELTNEEVSASRAVSQWATFDLAGETYGVNVMNIREVLRHQNMTQVPGAPDFVEGIINLRGNVITIVNMRLRLGVRPADVSDMTRIMIAEVDDYTLGFVVDSVADVLDMDASQVDPSPSVNRGEVSNYIEGVTYVQDELLILLDLKRIVLDDVDRYDL